MDGNGGNGLRSQAPANQSRGLNGGAPVRAFRRRPATLERLDQRPRPLPARMRQEIRLDENFQTVLWMAQFDTYRYTGGHPSGSVNVLPAV